MKSLAGVLFVLPLMMCANLVGCGETEEPGDRQTEVPREGTGAGSDGETERVSNPFLKALGEAEVANCKHNLRQLAVACARYLASVGENRFMPPGLKALLDEEILTETQVFVCPQDKREGEGWRCSYESLFGLTDKRLTDRLSPQTLMIWDNAPRHAGGRCVARVDCSVGFLKEAEFQKKLQEAKNALGTTE